MSPWKIFIVFILMIVLIALFFSVFKDFKIWREDIDELESLQAQIEEIKTESSRITDDVEYYSDPHNLEKELKSRFNYKKIGEQLLIVVPSSE